MLKYQIFVSSTYEDLKPERDLLIKAILEMGHIPVGMEMFSAADEQQWALIKNQIEQSDYYVVLVAHRYGSMDGEISFTEKEYDFAMENGIPVLGFMLEDDVDWPPEWIENNQTIKGRLDHFKAKVTSRMISYWRTPEDLYGKCSIALMKTFATQPREGWVRASAADTSEMTAEITRLSRENGALRNRIVEGQEAERKSNESRIREVIEALRRNSRKIYIWRRSATGWGDPIDTNLLEIFENMVPDLLDEASNSTLIETLGFAYAGNDVRPSGVAIPTNFLKAYMADLIGLDLITTSTKRHSVKDTKAYWMLTEQGREIHSNIRRSAILRGGGTIADNPEEGDHEESVDAEG